MKLALTEQEYRKLCEMIDCFEDSSIEIINPEDNSIEKSVTIDCYSKIKNIADTKTDLDSVDDETISDILWQIQADFDFIDSIVEWNYQDDFRSRLIDIFSKELEKRKMIIL